MPIHTMAALQERNSKHREPKSFTLAVSVPEFCLGKRNYFSILDSKQTCLLFQREVMISVFQSCSLYTHLQKNSSQQRHLVSLFTRYAETQEIHERLSTSNDCRKKHSLSLDANKQACSLDCYWQPLCDNKDSQAYDKLTHNGEKYSENSK